MDLNDQIEDLIEQGSSDFEISKLIKGHIKHYLASLNDIFVENQGKDFLVKHTKNIDNFILLLYKYTLRKHFGNYMPFQNAIPIALVAMGSYGREELCVYSDIDLMIVYKEISGYNIEPIIKSVLHLAWDAGMKLGHRVHKIEELFDASNKDLTIKTAMMESRFLCGSKILWIEAERSFARIRKTEPKKTIEEILQATQKRRSVFPFSMEPNIKEGVGGLRDAHAIYWIAKILFGISRLRDLVPTVISEEEFREFRSALEFLYRVRSALHLSAKKKQDVLNLEYIPDVAKILGFKNKALKNAQLQLSEKTLFCMHTIDITCRVFAKKLVAPIFFSLESIKILRQNRCFEGVYMYENSVVASFKKPPLALSKVLEQLQIFGDKDVNFDISYVNYVKNCTYLPHNSKKIYRQIRGLFFARRLYPIFSLLYDASLLSQLIKPFKRALNLAQFDGYHRYPVDIHSLHTLYHLENINDTFITSLYEDLCPEGKAIMKLIAFTHDIGKGRNGDHSEIGAKIFKAYATKLGFAQEAIASGVVLIKNHTLMSNTVSREDIYSEKVVFAFISKLQSPQILKMLYILTYADMSAVAENIYSGFSARLLREFYDFALDSFEKNKLIDEATKRLKKENTLKKNSEFLALPKALQKKTLSIKSNFFFIKQKPHEIIAIVQSAEKTEKEYSFSIKNDSHLSITIVRTKAFNIGYFLGKLTFLDLVNMEIYKLFDEKKYFQIDFQEKVEDGSCAYIEELLSKSFDMKKKAQIAKPTILKNEISLECNHSKSYAMMRINTKNQKGLMAYMMSVFDEQNIDIAMAKIQTIKNRTRNLLLIEKTINLCDNKEEILHLFI
ncbi:MAG: HD domain-containing protein [Sulfurospirillaceae bacterium]|nr:HD domain-containing protein [Sulfurospirillaceae bacterium]